MEIDRQPHSGERIMKPLHNSSFCILPLLAHQLSGEALPAILEELSNTLAA